MFRDTDSQHTLRIRTWGKMLHLEQILEPSANKQKSKILQIILLVISLAVMTYILSKLDMKQVDALATMHKNIGMIVVILLYVLLAATPIPAEPLTILTAAIYTPLTAALLAGTGFTLGSMVEYYIGSKFSKSSNIIENKEKMPLGLGKVPVESPYFQLLGRLIPGYGAKVVSFISGYYRVPMSTYLWTSTLVNFLGAIIYAYGGYQIFAQIFPNLRRP